MARKLTINVSKIEKETINNIVKTQQEIAMDIRDDVRKLAPKDTGRYADSIKVGETIVSRNKITTEIYTDATVISSNGTEYNLGYLLETGTSPHLIEPVNSNVLHFLINGQDVYAKRVNHPGTVAQPHFEPALKANEHRYNEAIKEAVRRSFQ